jgi:uncharacterized membrane protein
MGLREAEFSCRPHMSHNMITTMRQAIGWLLAGISAILWVFAIVVAFTFEGVTGPAILLGWLILLTTPLSIAALLLLRSR